MKYGMILGWGAGQRASRGCQESSQWSWPKLRLPVLFLVSGPQNSSALFSYHLTSSFSLGFI